MELSVLEPDELGDVLDQAAHDMEAVPAGLRPTECHPYQGSPVADVTPDARFEITITSHVEWAVLWPSGDDEIIDSETVVDPQAYAIEYAMHFNPPPHVVSRTVRVTTECSEWALMKGGGKP